MESVLEIEAAIQRLPKDQMFDLVGRLERRLSDAWDRQFETDVLSGSLDAIAKQALAEHQSGRSKPFPEDAQ